MHVERHEIDATAHATLLISAVDDIRHAPERIALHPGYLVTLAERSRLVLCLTAADPTGYGPAVAVGAQAAAGVFQIAEALGNSESVVVRLGAGRRQVAVLDLGQDAGAALWLRGFALSCVARDMRAIEILRKFNADELFAEPGRGWEVDFVRTLQRWIENDPAWRESFAEARAALTASGDAADTGFVADLAVLDLIPAISDIGFESALPRALEAHRAHYAKSPADPLGLVALMPLALCVLLRARGVLLPVSSPYLPPYWLDGPTPGVKIDPSDPERAEAIRSAMQVVSRLRGPEQFTQIAEILPHPGDAALVFRADPARVEAEYDRLFQELRGLPIEREQTAIDIYIARSDEFTTGVKDVARFPGGYRRIAALLQPGLWWIAWRYRRPDATDGLFFDGLVRVGGRWAWFPRPWRTLG